MKFHYIKSYDHKEIQVDGAFGGVMPTGAGLTMTVFTERTPIPKSVTHVVEDGVLGDEDRSKRDVLDGVVRVVGATLHMDLDQARSLHEWLGKHISRVEDIQQKMEQQDLVESDEEKS